MDINSLLQMLQQRFGQGSGGQQAFAGGGMPGGYRETPYQVQPPGQQGGMTTPVTPSANTSQIGTSMPQANPAYGGMLGMMGGGQQGGGNIMQSIMQMMQRGRGGMSNGFGRQMMR
jgi:hypothetical protein